MTLESFVALGSLAVALGSLAVTVITVLSSRKERDQRAREAEEARRRTAVGVLIDRLEKVARVQNRPIYGRLWARPELEFMLAVPRLNLILKDEEQPISEWLGLQVQLMNEEPTNKRAAIRGVDAAAELSKWYRGRRSPEWFQREVAKSRSRSAKGKNRTWLRQTHATGEATATTLLIVTSVTGTLVGLHELENAAQRFLSFRRGSRRAQRRQSKSPPAG